MSESAVATGPRLHHVGVVQPSLQRVDELLALLGLREAHRGEVEAYAATCIFTDPNGSSPIEFVVPHGGPLASFNRGAGGLHHLAIEVDSLPAVAAELAGRGIPLLEPTAVRGAGGFLCNFLSPVYTRGLIVEFVEILSDDGDEGEDRGGPFDPAAVVANALRAAQRLGEVGA